jgi:hypothetical protein
MLLLCGVSAGNVTTGGYVALSKIHDTARYLEYQPFINSHFISRSFVTQILQVFITDIDILFKVSTELLVMRDQNQYVLPWDTVYIRNSVKKVWRA